MEWARRRRRSALLVVLGAAACAPPPELPWPPASEGDLVAPAEMKVEAPPPPFSDGVFPCTDCHDPEIPVNTRRRPMQMAHQDVVFEHDQEHRWCLDCHATKDRDKLQLADGQTIDFTESYRLCGQCHGDKYRDWRAGVHGRRTGYWNGPKTYLLCVHCHGSHSPAFKPLRPMPAPARPDRGR